MIAETTKTSRIRPRQSQCLQQGRRRYDGDITQPSEAVWHTLSTIYDTVLHSFCFYLAPQHVFICLWNLDLSFASCTSCTSAMHDITQLWGMYIIGKEEEEEEGGAPARQFENRTILKLSCCSQTVMLVHICTRSFSKISTCDSTRSTYEDHYSSKLLIRFPSPLWGDGVFGDERSMQTRSAFRNHSGTRGAQSVPARRAFQNELKVCRLTAM